jgi:hypothetical protein
MPFRVPWRDRPRRTWRSSAILIIMVAAACAHRPPVAPPAPEGTTSVRVLTAPESAPAGGATGEPAPPAERITPAYASADNRLPDYPASALKAGCGGGIVAVRVHLNVEGNVSAQRDVPGRPLPADDCHMAFRASIQSAVNAWRFAPAFRQTPVRDPAADPSAPVLRWKQEPIAVYLDFEFTFAVVAGKGVVRTR